MIEAADVPTAVREASRAHIDVLIWDLRIPGADPACPARWIDEAGALARAHRIALSLLERDLSALSESERRALAAFFVKPFSLAELAARMRRLPCAPPEARR